ncbi:MAG: PEP-CTERM sorting domain-containing protein [Phycisphaerae bacterium]
MVTKSKMLMVSMMVLVCIGMANASILLQDDFTGNNVVADPAKWSTWNSGAVYLSNDKLYASNMEEVRTVPTFNVTVPGQPIKLDVDLVERNESTGGTDAWTMKVTDTANTNYLKLRVWGFTGGWGVYGHEISLKLVTDSGETNLFNDQLYTGSNNPGPFHVAMTVDNTNVGLLVTGNLLGDGVQANVAHGASLGNVFFHLTDSNTGEYVLFDNAMVSQVPEPATLMLLCIGGLSLLRKRS